MDKLIIEFLKIGGTAILSFVSSYVIFRLSKKKEKKEISYDLKITNGLLNIKEVIKNDTKVLFKNNPADKLSYIEIDFYNSGDYVIKNQEIRLECPVQNQILEIIYEPKLEPELHFEELSLVSSNEKKLE